MRYRHIKEGIRMGSKDLASPPKKNYTMGFEVEVAVSPDLAPEEYEYNGDDYNEYDYETQWDRAYDEYIDQNGYPSFEEWLRYNSSDLDLQDLEPRWGWYGKSFDEIMAEQPNEDEIREIFKQIIPAFFNNTTRTMEEISNNPSVGEKYEKIITDLAKQLEVEHLPSLKSEQFDLETNKTENLYDAYSIREAIKHILKKLNAEVNIHMTEKVNDKYYYVMNEDGEPIRVDELRYLEEILELFDTNEDDLKDLAGESYTNWADEIINSGVDEIISNQTHEESSSLGSIAMLVDDYMDVNSTINGTNYRQWNIVPDGTEGVDAEITSPISSVEQSLTDMKAIFEMIDKNNEWVYTTRQCGLHINIGTWTPEEVHKIDWLKFMLLVRGDRILAEFNRSNNSFAVDKLPKIVSALKGYTPYINSYFDDLMMVNKVVLKTEKFSAINFTKLFSSKPHIEVRAFGNENYHQKFDKIKEYTLRVIRALEIASDPNAYRKEYLNMLYKHFGSKFFDETKQINLDKAGSEYENAKLINKFYDLWGNAFPELKLSQITYFGSDFLYVMTNICNELQIFPDKKDEYEKQLQSIENRITKEMVKVYLDLGDIPKNKGYKYKLKPDHMEILKKYPKINYMMKKITDNK